MPWPDRLGVVAAFRLEPLATYIGFSVGVPVANVAGSIHDFGVQASIDEFGLSDLYVQPLRLGWRLPQLDLVAGLAMYVPTGRFEPGGIASVGAGQFSRELSLGATVYFDPDKVWRVSALSTFESNQYKRDVDIRRGNDLQVQGGKGVALSWRPSRWAWQPTRSGR